MCKKTKGVLQHDSIHHRVHRVIRHRGDLRAAPLCVSCGSSFVYCIQNTIYQSEEPYCKNCYDRLVSANDNKQ